MSPLEKRNTCAMCDKPLDPTVDGPLVCAACRARVEDLMTRGKVDG